MKKSVKTTKKNKNKKEEERGLPGVPGRFLLFLAAELEVGLGLGFGDWSIVEKPAAMVAGSEKGSPDIFIILSGPGGGGN
ncbi:hypothetical protein CDL15_Pgr001969 [Punica granatum]|uniref:Uncharacterized protein n=1 Tax=Punica granatum TaxID=22663 RepID=A0A218XAZ5_PUNGR|nr:hypothetical protein CDL15_Pgr001969 [Punica granatum]